MPTLEDVAALMEIGATLFLIPFGYLTWASGYMDILVEAARAKGRWPRRR